MAGSATATEEDERPDHVVPIPNDINEAKYLGLVLDENAYTKSVSLIFSPIEGNEDQTVRAEAIRGRKGLHFTDSSSDRYEWIANLKQRRAMRAAQWVGQDMGRIGFDEFEPFRPDPKSNK